MSNAKRRPAEPRFKIAHLFQDPALENTFGAAEDGLDGAPPLPAPSGQRQQIETVARAWIVRAIRDTGDREGARYTINSLLEAYDWAMEFGLDRPSSLGDYLSIIGLAAIVKPDQRSLTEEDA